MEGGRLSNPFEKYDIDPLDGPEAITARLRELAEDADGTERDELRAEWERLTMHPQSRLEAALEAFPETRSRQLCPPPKQDDRPAPGARGDIDVLTLRDVALLPSVAAALVSGQNETLALLPPFHDDPHFRDPNLLGDKT